MKPNFIDLFKTKVDLTMSYYEKGQIEKFCEECQSINAISIIKNDIIKEDKELASRVEYLKKIYKEVCNKKSPKK